MNPSSWRLCSVARSKLFLSLITSIILVSCNDAGVCTGPLCGLIERDTAQDAGNDGDGAVDAPTDLSDEAPRDAVRDPDVVADPDSAITDPGADPRVDTDRDVGVDTTGQFELEAQPVVSFPFVVAGETMSNANLEVLEVGGLGSTDGLSVSVEGPFAVDGELTPLAAGETRRLAASYTGSTSEPALVTGEAHISADDQSVWVDLFAVIGHPDLPTGTWTMDDYGTRAVLAFPSAPFPHESASYTDSSVIIVVPPGLTDRESVGVVCHLHGHNAIVTDRVAEQYLVELHAMSGRNAVFIAPQGPVLAASGNFGKLHEEGGFRNLVEDVVAVLYRDGFIERPVVGDVAVTSHSGGYRAAADVMTIGGLPIQAIQLYDSLYARESDFEFFARNGGVLRSNYTTTGGTRDDNLALAASLESASVEVGTVFSDAELQVRDTIIGYTSATHSNCMWDERTAGRWLATSGLYPRPNAPPELLATEMRDGDLVVSWRADRGEPNATFKVQRSDDGVDWVTVGETNSTSMVLTTDEGDPRMRVVRSTPGFGESEPSDTYGATGQRWLVVDGFDRVLGGSYSGFTHAFAADIANALGEDFSIASNEAVVDGLVDLSGFWGVLWMLGDESVHDVTFDADERAAIEGFVGGGGRLIVSGAEVGYATNSAWLSSELHATYVSDDAGTDGAGGYTFGVAYEEDYPDVLSGQTTIWAYDTSGAAAVGWNNQVIVVGFPLETLAEAVRETAVQELVDWLE